MKNLFLLLFVFTFLTSLSAQVVNTEKLRMDRKEKGWVGEIGLNFGLNRNKAGETIRLGSRARLEYLRGRDKLLFFGAYNLSNFRDVYTPGAASQTFVNNRFAHLRYNRDLSSFITMEAFSQSQWDGIQEIDLRFLSGGGPRFRLADSDTLHLYIGTLYMYEYEESNDLVTVGPEEQERSVTRRHHRLSAYLSAGINIQKLLTINHVTYFQPRFDFWADFRVSSETTLSVTLTSKLRLNTFFQLIYDTRPPIGVPETMYMLSNGLSLSL
jgi:hypothetical protein